MGELNKHEARRNRLLNRNNAIKKEYEELSDKKYKNVRMYTEELKILKLAEKFFLSEKTVEDIVYNRIKYEHEPVTQLKLDYNEE